MTPAIPVPRTAKKGVRDLLVIGASSILLALAEQGTDFGIPLAYTPLVSTVALALYRAIRDKAGGAIA